jgi:hypothetical protein
VFAVRQRMRADAQAVVSALRARGVAIEILSGVGSRLFWRPRERSGSASGAPA